MIRRESSSSSTSRRRLSFLRSRPRRVRVCRRRRVRVCRRRRRRRRHPRVVRVTMRVDRVEDRRIGRTDRTDGSDRTTHRSNSPVAIGRFRPSPGRSRARVDRPTDRPIGSVGGSTERAGKRTETGIVRWVDRGGCVKPYGFVFIMCDFILERVVSVVLKAFNDHCVCVCDPRSGSTDRIL